MSRGGEVARLAMRIFSGIPSSGRFAPAAASLAPRAAVRAFGSAARRPSSVRESLRGSWVVRAGAGEGGPSLARSLFIQTQSTPNPTSLMFVPGRDVMGGSEGGTASFSSPRESMASPLAKALFAVDGVTGVFLGSDFVTVTKSDEYEWPVIKPDVFAAMTEFFASGQPVVIRGDGETHLDAASAAHQILDTDDEIVAMIKELLETRIRPAVQEDGGDVAFAGWDEDSGLVTLKMMGSCQGCPSSALTLKGGIENMLKHYIPEVTEVVEAPPDEAETEGLKAFKALEEKLSI